MIKKLLLGLFLPLILFGQTHIVDTLYNPSDTSPTSTVSGSLSIVSQAMQANGSVYVKTITPYTITAGLISLYLEPNDTTTNLGSYYTVNYTIQVVGKATTVNYSEKWVVPTSGSALLLSQVRVSTITASPSVIILPSQIAPGSNGQCLITVGGVSAYSTCPGGGGGVTQCTYTVTFSSTPNFDFSNCPTQVITLAGNISPTFLNSDYCEGGLVCSIVIIQNNSTAYTVTWGSNVHGGFQIGGQLSKYNIESFTSDGTNLIGIGAVINQ